MPNEASENQKHAAAKRRRMSLREQAFTGTSSRRPDRMINLRPDQQRNMARSGYLHEFGEKPSQFSFSKGTLVPKRDTQITVRGKATQVAAPKLDY